MIHGKGDELRLSVLDKQNTFSVEYDLSGNPLIKSEFECWRDLKWTDQGWKPDPTIFLKDEKRILVVPTKKASHYHWSLDAEDSDRDDDDAIDLDYPTVVFYDLE